MLTDRELQTLRNMGNESEAAADEIDRLRAARRHKDAEIGRLRSLITRAVAGYASDDAAVPTCVSILREALGPSVVVSGLAVGKSAAPKV